MRKLGMVVLLVMPMMQAHAQLQAGDQLLSLHGGIAAPVSDLDYNDHGGSKDTVADPGGSFGVQYLYHLLPMLGLGLDISGSHFSDRSSSELIFNAQSVSSGSSFDVMTIVRCAFLPSKRFHPFVDGGLGFSNTSVKVESTPDSGAVWSDTGTSEKRTLVDSSRPGLALLLGGGIDFFINDHLFVGGEERLMSYATRTYTSDSAEQRAHELDGTVVSLNTLARIGWKF